MIQVNLNLWEPVFSACRAHMVNDSDQTLLEAQEKVLGFLWHSPDPCCSSLPRAELAASCTDLGCTGPILLSGVLCQDRVANLVPLPGLSSAILLLSQLLLGCCLGRPYLRLPATPPCHGVGTSPGPWSPSPAWMRALLAQTLISFLLLWMLQSSRHARLCPDILVMEVEDLTVAVTEKTPGAWLPISISRSIRVEGTGFPLFIF